MIIKDHTFSVKRFSPLVYDTKTVSHLNKIKPGSLAYDDFWDEIDYYCLNGFSPKGMHSITGEHFAYLNLAKIEMLHQGEKRKRPGSPYYRELDNRLFKETYDAKKFKYGLIVGKPRRVGLSWFGAWQIVYEMIFHMENRVGICAGKQEKADSFYAKVVSLFDKIIEPYKVGRILKNDKILKIGYSDIENKQQVDRGLCSEMLIRTMFADAAGFEGESMSIAIFEEAGLFQNLISSYKSTEPCFREGANQFGTPLIYGTGGEIEKGAKGYKEMWEQYQAYNLKKIFIPADEYYPGDGEIDEKTGIQAPSFFNIETGKTDRAKARTYILKEREKAKKSKDSYIKHIQNYPLEEKEIFLKSTGGLLDRVLLSNQAMILEEGNLPVDVRRGKLEWIDDPITAQLVSKTKNTQEACKIRVKRDVKVKWVDDENGSIYRCADPINKNEMDHKPDIAGCDSYDEEVQTETGSLGATVVYRTYAGPSREYNYPVSLLYERGDSSSDDIFFENNVKMAIYWNYKVLVEYSKIAIIKYFEDVEATQYLKEKPDLRKELGSTKSKNTFGQRMTTDVKNLVTKLLKKDVKENSDKYWFLIFINDLMDYGDKNTDIAMAFGLCLLYKLELFEDILEDYEEVVFGYNTNELDSMSYYHVDSNNKISIKTYDGENIDDIQTFNPNFDMSEQDRIDLRIRQLEEKKEYDKRKKEILNSRTNMLENLIKEELMKNN